MARLEDGGPTGWEPQKPEVSSIPSSLRDWQQMQGAEAQRYFYIALCQDSTDKHFTFWHVFDVSEEDGDNIPLTIMNTLKNTTQGGTTMPDQIFAINGRPVHILELHSRNRVYFTASTTFARTSGS
jgi:hypothetical protein